MYKYRYVLTAILGLGILIGLSACGGNSNPATANTTSATTGPITAFGSLYVNSVEYNTDNANIYFEDKLASESALKVGMIVTIQKTSNNQASSVYYSDEVKGIVITNNIPSGSTTGELDVMGQKVTVNDGTIFESYVTGITDVSMIQQGNVVEVSGYSSGKGLITATRLEVKSEKFIAGTDELEVKGIVGNYDGVNFTFNIGNLEIYYKDAVLEYLPNGIKDGLYVEAKSTNGLNASMQLIASKVELKNQGSKGYHGDEDEEYEVRGLIMEISDTSLTVNGQVIKINDITEFSDADRSMFVVGTLVEVEGRFNANKELVAKKVEFEDSHYGNSTELKGTVATINATDTNIGKITLDDGITIIIVNNNTVMYGGLLNLKDLKSGDYIEVKAVANGDNPVTYTALKIKRKKITSSMP